MQNFRTLKCLDKISGLFTFFGVDYPMMRRILQIKLMMDARRVPTLLNQSSKRKRSKDGNLFIKSLWIYAVIGLLLIPFVIFSDHFMFPMSIIFGIVMFMISTAMISDFSTVLLDLRDKAVLSTKPIDSKTIHAAKTVHIFIYMLFLTIALTGGVLVAGLIKHGILFFLLFIIELILIDLFVVIITALVYFLILKFFDGEKLKDMINYVQIALSFVIFVGYQVLIHSFEFMNLNVTMHMAWWQIFLPPLWFAAPFEWLLRQESTRYYIVFSCLSVCIPLISIFIYNKLMPSFEGYLQKLSAVSINKKSRKNIIRDWIAKIVCRDKEERYFYQFVVLMMKNERDFKLKVYPILGFSIVIPFIFMYIYLNDNSWSSIRYSKTYLYIYFSLIMISTAVMMLKYSSNYKGAWIYQVAPIQSKKIMVSAALKAFLIHLFLPIYVILSAMFLFIFNLHILPDLFAVFCATPLYTMMTYKIMNNRILPFSEAFRGTEGGDSVKFFILMLLILPFAGLHFVATLIPLGTIVYLVILVIANRIMWKKFFHYLEKNKLSREN